MYNYIYKIKAMCYQVFVYCLCAMDASYDNRRLEMSLYLPTTPLYCVINH